MKTEKRTCPLCGKEFTPTTSKQTYCSWSCGARSRRSVDPAEIVGQRNGKCTVIGPAAPDRFGHSRIMVRCDCGTEFSATLTQWVRNHKPIMCRRCADLRVMKPERDRTGEKIGSLTILGMEGEWRGETLTKYRVRCEQCGSETVMDGSHLRVNKVCVYCGRKNLAPGRQIFRDADVEGTNLYMLRNTIDGTRAVNRNSSSGVTGVNRQGNRWRAVIVFKRKQYTLGVYDTIEDAAKRRKEAEEHLYRDFLEWYEAEGKKRQVDAMPETERVLYLWSQKPKVNAVSVRAGIPVPRVRRILIDNGIYPTARARQIKELSDAGLTPEQIAERLRITTKTVEGFLPYQRGTYSGDSATTAWRRSKEGKKRL